MSFLDLNIFDKYEIISSLLSDSANKRRSDLARFLFIQWAEFKNYEDRIKNLKDILQIKDQEIESLNLALAKSKKKKVVSE